MGSFEIARAQDFFIAIEYATLFALGIRGRIWTFCPWFVLSMGICAVYNYCGPIQFGLVGQAIVGTFRILTWLEACGNLVEFEKPWALPWLQLAGASVGCAAAILMVAAGVQDIGVAYAGILIAMLLYSGSTVVHRFRCHRSVQLHFHIMAYTCALVTLTALTRPLYGEMWVWLLIRWVYAALIVLLIPTYWTIGNQHLSEFRDLVRQKA